MTVALSKETSKKPLLLDIVPGFKANSLDICESFTHSTSSLLASFLFTSTFLVYAGVLGDIVCGVIICLWPVANPSVECE